MVQNDSHNTAFHPRDHQRRLLVQSDKAWGLFFVARKAVLYQLSDGDVQGWQRPEPLRKLTDLNDGYSHYSCNAYRRTATTHSNDNLNAILKLGIDIDCGDDLSERRDAFERIQTASGRIGSNPTAVVKTPDGYHVSLNLQYPIFVAPWTWEKSPDDTKRQRWLTSQRQQQMAMEANRRLIAAFGGDKQQPLFNLLLRFPEGLTDLIYSDPEATITCRQIFQTLTDPSDHSRYYSEKRKVSSSPSPNPSFKPDFEPKNGTLYTALLIARRYGIAPATAVNDLNEKLGMNCESVSNFQSTLNSCYKGRRHPKNYFAEHYGLGTVGSFGRFMGWCQEARVGSHNAMNYVRKTDDNELYSMKVQTLAEANARRRDATVFAMQKAELDMLDEGKTPSSLGISVRSGVSRRIVVSYKGVAWGVGL